MKRSLRSWLWHVPLDMEVDEEIAFHIEMRTRELVEGGMDPKTAREIVLARIGDAGRLKRTCVDLGRKRDREMRLTQVIEELRDDVKFALRQMRAAPAFALVAVITLALGIGANSAMFALADATFLRPLPFAGPADRLVMVWERRTNGFTSTASPLEFREWNEQNRSFETMASIAAGGMTMRGADGSPEPVRGQVVTVGFFDVLGVTPIAGRTFLPADLSPAPAVVVVSEGLWRRRFGADPGLVGREVVIEGRSLTVVGVMPADFQIVAPFVRGGAAAADVSDVWTLASQGGSRVGQTGHYVHVIGRLKPGVTAEAAQSEVAVIAAEAAREFPDSRDHGIVVEPLRQALIGPELRLTSVLLLGVVGFVLLMCCANVANLLMSRTTARARELAVRSALGAGRRRIAVQLLTESLVLATCGGLLGVGVGAAIVTVAPVVIPPGLLPSAVTLTFDARVMAFCGLTAFVVGVLFGLGPAWQSTRASLVQAIASDRRSTRQSGTLRSLLVVGEVATAVLVLSGAGLLLRAWISLDSVDPGYRAPEALTMAISLPMVPPTGGPNRYGTQDGLRQFYAAAQREIETEPGVRSATWGGALPLDGIGFMQPFTVVGDATSPGRPVFASYHMVSPTYFETMSIPVVSGRGFTDSDSRDGVPVCIVSEAFVRRFLGNREPIGQRVSVPMLSLGSGPPVVREIVGVAKQVRGRPEELGPPPQIYVPIAQNAWFQATLIVRPASGAPASLLPSVRAAIARVDNDRPVTRVRTLDSVATEATSRPRFRALLVASFAMLALILAMVGVFGVLAYSVQQRTRELGVRIALGASAGSVLRLVLSSASRTILIGTAIGLMTAAALGRSISTFLFGVQPLDPVTFIAVPIVLMATAALAVAAPAWRAARVDPVVAFRNE
ncbi:MAG TPA: ABC transporter permease [Vicinamibacterales bacterium]|nr:ABC transporter permease [Vicinamibacterales bacterium]